MSGIEGNLIADVLQISSFDQAGEIYIADNARLVGIKELNIDIFESLDFQRQNLLGIDNSFVIIDYLITTFFPIKKYIYFLYIKIHIIY
jgi:hypothetical protein